MPLATQSNFSGGIMSPLMLGRTDDNKYKAGLKECENMYILPQGAIQNRSGFRMVREVKDSTRKVKLIPFAYSSDQTMVLEFGHKYIRFHSQAMTLKNTDGSPYEVVTPYEEQDLSALDYVQSADILTIAHKSYPPMELRRYSERDWRLVESELFPTITAPINVRAWKKSTAKDEVNANNYTFRYVVTSLADDRLQESEKSEEATCTANIYNTGTTIQIEWDKVAEAAAYRVYRRTAGVWALIGETEDCFIVDDNIDPDGGYTPPIYDNPFNVTKSIGTITVTNGGSGYGTEKRVTGIKKTGGTITGWRKDSYKRPISGTINIQNASLPLAQSVIRANSSPATSVLYMDFGGMEAPIVGSGSGGVARFVGTGGNLADILVVSEGSGYNENSYVTFAGYYALGFSGLYLIGNNQLKYATTYMEVTFPVEVDPVKPEVIISDPTGTGAEAEAIIENGRVTGVRVISGGQNYTNPVVTFVDKYGRGATATAKIDTSGRAFPSLVTYFEQRKVFGATNKDPQAVWMTKTGTENNLTYSIPLRDDDRVNFKIASRERNSIRHLVPMNRLFALTEAAEWVVTSLADAVTPSAVAVKAQSYIGANKASPLVVNNNMLYCAASGGHVRELGYSYDSGGYITGDISLRAAHLFDHYEITDMAFSKAPCPIGWFVSTSGDLLGLTYIPEQSVGAWHKHTTDGVFESVCVVAEGDSDMLYAVIRRTINGKVVRFIERMEARGTESLEDSFFVDCGETYRGDPTRTVTGIDWLEGCTVNILADGCEIEPQEVRAGMITLPVKASVIHVGLPIKSRVVTLPVSLASENGDATYLNKNVNKVHMRLYRSSGIFVGPEDGEMVEFKQRKNEPLGSPPNRVTGLIDIPVKAKWGKTGSITIEQTSPLPITILSIATDIAFGG